MTDVEKNSVETAEVVESEVEIRNVYRQEDEAVSERVIAFWQANNALTSEVAEVLKQRAEQVVAVVEKEGEIIGVSSVFVGKSPRNGQLYYYYRSFLLPAYRGELIWLDLLKVTYAILEAWEPKKLPSKPLGLVLRPEFTLVVSRQALPTLASAGFRLAGRTQRGPVVLKPFPRGDADNTGTEVAEMATETKGAEEDAA